MQAAQAAHTDAERDSLATAFESAKTLIKQVVWRFAANLGRLHQYDELFAEASIHWISAHQDYDGSRECDYAKYVKIRIWHRLFDAHRLTSGSRRKNHARLVTETDLAGQFRRRNREQETGNGQSPIEQMTVSDSFYGRAERLSIDGRAVFDLLGYRGRSSLKTHVEQPLRFLSNIVGELRGSGWTSERIDTAFDELRGIL